MTQRQFVSLGMFIVDQFLFEGEDGNQTGRSLDPQIGGGGTYATIGARIWLDPTDIGMVVDRGHDFPPHIQTKLDSYGPDMWLFRDDPTRETTTALNHYRGDHRGFKYLTPRIRLTPRDLNGTAFDRPQTLHFICSPTRALAIIKEVKEVEGWLPVTVYEPIPDRCVPGELPSLIEILPSISILSPNAEEALGLLSISLPITQAKIEEAAAKFLDYGIGGSGKGSVVIRSGALGAYVASRAAKGRWVEAFWGPDDLHRVIDVTGAGNAFLGGLGAGLKFTQDVYEAALYASVSASFIIEQEGLPLMELDGGSRKWNGDSPQCRLSDLRNRTFL
ncbi:Ribokinase-like protein [Thelephora ganbajun]|uniref:Ribokinase-like protein n=1 Tax=Thelephora ganbajun TaxID=370292 RepID=A0ACB6ZBS4_THEGA|nr:Ribokinase-like protein [Thelephora ganbajun]